jgi:tetratricopeptide (TPR) repeat protein
MDLTKLVDLLGFGFGTSQSRRDVPSTAAFKRELKLAREDAAGRPSPRLAAAIEDLATRFAVLGKREDALVLNQEAVQIRRDLAVLQFDEDRTVLAMSLSFLAGSLDSLKRHEEALLAIQESVQIRRDLVSRQSDAGRLRELAVGLTNVCHCLCNMGRYEVGLAAVEEALSVLHELAARQPDYVRSQMIRALTYHAKCLESLGRTDESRTEATRAFRLSRLRDSPEAKGPAYAPRFPDGSSRKAVRSRRRPTL